MAASCRGESCLISFVVASSAQTNVWGTRRIFLRFSSKEEREHKGQVLSQELPNKPAASQASGQRSETESLSSK